MFNSIKGFVIACMLATVCMFMYAVAVVFTFSLLNPLPKPEPYLSPVVKQELIEDKSLRNFQRMIERIDYESSRDIQQSR